MTPTPGVTYGAFGTRRTLRCHLPFTRRRFSGDGWCVYHGTVPTSRSPSDSIPPSRTEWRLPSDASEGAIRESAEQFRLIAGTTSEVLWMATFDMSRMVYVSPAYERVWGRSCESLYSDPKSFMEGIFPDDLPGVLKDVDAKKEGQTLDHEYRLRRPDGSIRWIWNRGWPARGEDGEIVHYVGIAQDITDRKLAEISLRESEARFRATFEQAAVGVTHVALDGRFLRVNQKLCDITGYGRDELSTRHFQAITFAEDAASDERVMKLLLGGEIQTHTAQKRLLRKDGNAVWIEVTSSLVLTPTGAPDYFMGVVVDISERRNIETQLRHAQKMEAIGVLAGGVAHDFNNMLQAIVLDAELAGLDPHVPPAVVDCLRNIRTVADRAGTLARQLLLFSRREVMQRQHLDINLAVTNLAAMLERIVGEDIRLELDLSTDAGRIHADAGMIDQVLMNLAVNARDAMPRGGTLTIETSVISLDEGSPRFCRDDATREYVRITVRDTGCGIPPDVLPRIFEPFFTTKEPGRGTGLGLATVFGIVEQHSGWTDVDSEVGRGTTFRVFLPAYAPDRRRRLALARGDARVGDETILLVEDDAIVRASMRAILAHYGYNVVEATTGPQALQRWDENGGKIDLVLTDLVMPGGMNGRELASDLVARRPDLRVVYATGYSADLAGRDLPLSRNERFLSKPVTADRLLETLRACLES